MLWCDQFCPEGKIQGTQKPQHEIGSVGKVATISQKVNCKLKSWPEGVGRRVVCPTEPDSDGGVRRAERQARVVSQARAGALE